MKGKIKLVPIGIPKEGMQVVWNNKVFTFEEDLHCSPVRYSELDKIVVEYEDKWNRYTELYMESIGDNPEDFKNIKIMPLHPEQWSWALAMIDKEVEFNREIIGWVGETKKEQAYNAEAIWGAKITTPTPSKDYIEEKNLKAKKFISEHGLPKGWGSTPVYPDIEQMAKDFTKKRGYSNTSNDDKHLWSREQKAYKEGFKACAEMYGIKLKSNNKV